MQHPHHKNTLLVTLVTLSFLTVLAFWLPQLKADVEGFAGGVQKSAQGLSTIDDQWRDAQEKIKELIPQPFKRGVTPPPPQQEQQASPEMQQALSTAVQEAAREEEGEVKRISVGSAFPQSLHAARGVLPGAAGSQHTEVWRVRVCKRQRV